MSGRRGYTFTLVEVVYERSPASRNSHDTHAMQLKGWWCSRMHKICRSSKRSHDSSQPPLGPPALDIFQRSRDMQGVEVAGSFVSLITTDVRSDVLQLPTPRCCSRTTLG